eukprot:1549667-Pyramimonas_sp.AAC.1
MGKGGKWTSKSEKPEVFGNQLMLEHGEELRLSGNDTKLIFLFVSAIVEPLCQTHKQGTMVASTIASAAHDPDTGHAAHLPGFEGSEKRLE